MAGAAEMQGVDRAIPRQQPKAGILFALHNDLRLQCQTYKFVNSRRF
jgi:hypothetical protein